MCDENLFLINLLNEMQLQKEQEQEISRDRVSGEELNIHKTVETIRVLEEKRCEMRDKIGDKSKQISTIVQGATMTKSGKPIIPLQEQPGFHTFIETAMTICESLFGKNKMQELLQMDKQQERTEPMGFGIILKMLGLIENGMHNKIEIYDSALQQSNQSLKSRQKWDEIIKSADDELMHRKYIEAQQREKATQEERTRKNVIRLAKT